MDTDRDRRRSFALSYAKDLLCSYITARPLDFKTLEDAEKALFKAAEHMGIWLDRGPSTPKENP